MFKKNYTPLELNELNSLAKDYKTEHETAVSQMLKSRDIPEQPESTNLYNFHLWKPKHWKWLETTNKPKWSMVEDEVEF